jgi:hypothetical protein
MRVLLRVVLAVLLLVTAAIIVTPATWLDRPLALHTHERLRLADAGGYWWRGHGVLTTNDGVARLPLAWRVAFAPLVAGRLVIELAVEEDSSMPTGTIDVRGDRIDVRDLHVTFPAAILPSFVPAMKALALSGDIVLHAPSFTWREPVATGAFDATWQHARVVAGAFAIDLGTVSASAAPAGNGIAGAIRNAGGDVTVDGTLSDRGGIIGASLALKPASSASRMLRTMLPLLGPGDGAGGVRLTWRSER